MANVVLGRTDPPESEWPGRWANEDDVAMACGDERDWFTHKMRLAAYRDQRARYKLARRRRRNLARHFNFAQIMIVGDMGENKSSLAVFEAQKWEQRGHLVVHNGPYLGGRYVGGSGIYQIVDRIPRNSVVLIDEAHTGLESGMAMAAGVREFIILCAGLRKKNCRLLLVSAMDTMVVRRAREMTSEVWKPLRPKVHTANFGYDTPLPGHSNPANFCLVWDIWRGFPYRGQNLIDRNGRKRGFGRPDDRRLVMGEAVRNAFLLNDSFQPVESATAHQFATKKAMDLHREREAHRGLTDDHRQLIGYLWNRSNSADAPLHIKAPAIALALGMPSAAVGRLLSALFGDVDGIQTAKGYDVDMMKDALTAKFNISE